MDEDAGIIELMAECMYGLDRSSRMGERAASEMNILKYSDLIMVSLLGFCVSYFSQYALWIR